MHSALISAIHCLNSSLLSFFIIFPFVVSSYIPEDKRERLIVILTVPATMLLLISFVIFYQVTQSKADVNRLKKHISTTEALHFLIANPHLTSHADEILMIKRDSIPVVMKLDSPKLKKKKGSRERAVSIKEQEPGITEYEDHANPETSGSVEPSTSHYAKDAEDRMKDHKDIFYIHDEVVAKNDSMCYTSIPFRRTKSERLIRNKTPFVDPPPLRLHRSNTGGLINLCFVNDSVIESFPKQQKQKQQELTNISKDLTSDKTCYDEDKVLTTTVLTNLTDQEASYGDEASSTSNLKIGKDENDIEDDKTDNIRRTASDDINDKQSIVFPQPDNRTLLEKFGDERIVEVTHF